jgi:flagellar biosynthesis protein FliQ
MMMLFAGPWIVVMVVEFTNTLIFNIPLLIG